MPGLFPSNSGCIPLIVIGVLLAALSTGCKTDPSATREIALLRAEIIDVEDKYARLRSKYEQTATRLSEVTGEPVEMVYPEYDEVILEGPITADGEIIYESTMPDGSIIQTIPDYGNAPRSSGSQNPATDSGNRSRQGQPIASPPPAEMRDQSLPGDSSGEADDRRGASTNVGSTLANRGGSNTVTEIRIEPQFSGGQNVDALVGHDGMQLLIQPRNAQGEVLAEAGELTVSLVDLSADGAQPRLGRWKFLPEETELFLVRETRQRGIRLHLPWDQRPPVGERVIANVRYRTADGRNLQTSLAFRITPPPASYSANTPEIQAWAEGAGQTGLATSSATQPEPVQSADRIDRPEWRPVR